MKVQVGEKLIKKKKYLIVYVDLIPRRLWRNLYEFNGRKIYFEGASKDSLGGCVYIHTPDPYIEEVAEFYNSYAHCKSLLAQLSTHKLLTAFCEVVNKGIEADYRCNI